MTDPARPIPGAWAALDTLLVREPRFALCLDTAEAFTWVTRPPGFGGLVHLILGQQVSTAAALAMWRRLTDRLWPVTPEGFLTLDESFLRSAGFSRQKRAYAQGAAAALVAGDLDLYALAGLPDDQAVETLTRLKGIGRWSAQVYLMMCLDRPDLWPVNDLALQLGTQMVFDLPDKPRPAQLESLAEAWRPWRSGAARLIWHYYIAYPERRPRPAASRASGKLS